MAALSDICVIPTEWEERAEHKEEMKAIGLSRKLAWKVAKKREHDRYKAYREREARRSGRGESFGASRKRVAHETMPEPMRRESRRDIFFAGQGKRSPKKVKNRYSTEQAGTVGRIITTKRFAGSRITCVCKSRML